jgi:hypothetical protein
MEPEVTAEHAIAVGYLANEISTAISEFDRTLKAIERLHRVLMFALFLGMALGLGMTVMLYKVYEFHRIH